MGNAVIISRLIYRAGARRRPYVVIWLLEAVSYDPLQPKELVSLNGLA